jgi:hypothetical protein
MTDQFSRGSTPGLAGDSGFLDHTGIHAPPGRYPQDSL